MQINPPYLEKLESEPSISKEYHRQPQKTKSPAQAVQKKQSGRGGGLFQNMTDSDIFGLAMVGSLALPIICYFPVMLITGEASEVFCCMILPGAVLLFFVVFFAFLLPELWPRFSGPVGLGIKKGGQYHIILTDEAHVLARQRYQAEINYQQIGREFAKELGLAKYETRDFPVAEMLATVFTAYEIQEEWNGVPQELRWENLRDGTADQIELQKIINKRAKLGLHGTASEQEIRDYNKGGFSSVIASFSANERTVSKRFKATVDYIAGESRQLKQEIELYKESFGPLGEPFLVVFNTIAQQLILVEIMRKNTAKRLNIRW